MDEDQSQPIASPRVKGLIAVGGVGAVLGTAAIPKVGIWVALAILVLFVLLVGGYFLYLILRKWLKGESFWKAVQQTVSRGSSASDPEVIAKLDALRKKFEEGVRV